MPKAENNFILTPQQIATVTEADRLAQTGNAARLWDLAAYIFALYSLDGASIRKLAERLQVWRSATVRVCKASDKVALPSDGSSPEVCEACQAKRDAVANNKAMNSKQRRQALDAIPPCEFISVSRDTLRNPSPAYVQQKLEAYQWASGAERKNGKNVIPQGLWYGLGRGVNPFTSPGGCTSVALAAEFVSRAHGNDTRDGKSGAKREKKSFAERMAALVKSGIRAKLTWPDILDACAIAYRENVPQELAKVVTAVQEAIDDWQSKHPAQAPTVVTPPALPESEPDENNDVFSEEKIEELASA